MLRAKQFTTASGRDGESEMQTEIISNGSTWGGQDPFPVEKLFERLASDPLDRIFESYGNFIEVDPVNSRGEALLPKGGVCFSGNFLTYSHVFDVRTTDPVLIERLTAAIRANQQRPDYLAQPDEAARQHAEREAYASKLAAEDAERARKLERELSSIRRRQAAA